MDPVIEMAIYIGRLEERLSARQSALEERLDELEDRPSTRLSVHMDGGSAEEPEAPPTEEAEQFRRGNEAVRKGIDNILSYDGRPQEAE